jgi:CRP-like cAMP-binding protein
MGMPLINEFFAERVLAATSLAVIGLLSLIIGAAIGIFSKPSPKVHAAVMAFGTGALIQAVVLELAYESAERLITEAGLQGIMSWMWVAAGFIVGGIIYSIGNKLIETQGGALRHPATTRKFLLERKREESEGILSKLSKVDFLCSLPPEEMENLLATVEPVKVAAGETIFRQGDEGDALYLIDSGEIDIFAANKKRTSKAKITAAPSSKLAHLGQSQSFGEMALLTGGPRSATAIAVTDCSMLKISKTDFDELINKSIRLRRAVEELNTQRLLQNVSTAGRHGESEQWQKAALASIQRMSRSEELALIKEHAKSGAPLAIFFGAMLDGIPESIVLGSSYVSLATFNFTFLAAVFLSNLPEGMASAAGMKDAGFSTVRIFRLWIGLLVAGALAAALGNVFLSTAPLVLLTLVEAVAGGGILAMVASVMMPEAYKHGGASVGLSTIAGFLTAFLFTFI